MQLLPDLERVAGIAKLRNPSWSDEFAKKDILALLRL